MDQRNARQERIPAGRLSDDCVTEPTIRVPVPSPNWIIIVAATEDRASAIELPRAAFTDPVLLRSLADMDYEMGKPHDRPDGS
jgi:hypothetical protein